MGLFDKGGRSYTRPEPLRVVVVDAFTSDEVIEMLGTLKREAKWVSTVGVAWHPEDAVETCRKQRPDCVLINYDFLERGVETIREISAAVPKAKMIVLSRNARALGGSADNDGRHPDYQVLQKPVVGRSLVKALEWAAAPIGVPEDSPVGVLRKKPLVFLVFAGKGGVGKSTLAANFAVALASGGNSTVLVDLDLQFGNSNIIATYGKEKSGTILDMLLDDGSFDPEGLDDALLDGPGGIKKLHPPTQLEFSDLVKAERLSELFDILKERFDAIVIDTNPYFDERCLTAVDNADEILVVTSNVVTSVENTRKTIDFLLNIHVDRGKIKLIVNQTTPDSYSSTREIEKVIDHPVSLALPYSPEVVDPSTAFGKPFVQSDPSTEIAKRVSGFAASFCGDERRVPGGTRDRRGRRASDWEFGGRR